MWWVLRHFSNRIIAVSEEVRQHHIRLAQFDPQKTITMYNGIDLSRFHQPPANNIREEFNIAPDAPLLLTVAVLREQKGIQYMIEAMQKIITTALAAKYLIVGDGSYADQLHQAVQQHGLTDHVIFTGARQDIPQILAASDIFILPTLLDALPTVLIEAMAASTPIVASSVGGVPELVENGRNGLLIPPAEPDALAQSCLQLLQNPEEARAMGRAGKKIAAQKFDIHKQVKKLGDVYLELLK